MQLGKDLNQNLIVKVMDQGIGMSKAEVATIFKPHFRTKDKESRKMNPYGNGLGLSISKGIAEGLGGTITCESTKDFGSTFKLVLPYKDQTAEEIHLAIAER